MATFIAALPCARQAHTASLPSSVVAQRPARRAAAAPARALSSARSFAAPKKSSSSMVDEFFAGPETPLGKPRPLWQIFGFSIPTGLLWYGWYKFCIEEELKAYMGEGFGGYLALGPFVAGLALGPALLAAGYPPEFAWASLSGLAWIYIVQYQLYSKVNKLFREKGEPEPLVVWWLFPIFFPLNLVVGLRQIHHLAQYWARERGETVEDSFAGLFPFITAPTLSTLEFFTKPSLWLRLPSSSAPDS